MDDRNDPLALWVGKWTPEDVIDVESRLLRQERPRPEHEREQRDPTERDAE